ncbi:hypothetical protein [Aquimarina rubra]|uniref:DUF3278 domain-containing protein n=1 Tax=Aquimarina rubra TaxID=1920033 RepID=A0ABW5LFH2_9FLAO
MKDLEELWAEIPKDDITQEKVDKYLKEKSNNELDQFTKILKVELGISILVAAALFMFYNRVTFSIWIVCLLSLFAGCILTLHTLKKLQKIKPTDSVRNYINACIRFLKTYLIQFFVTVHLVLISAVGILKLADYSELGWMDFFQTEQGKTLLILVGVLDLFMILYARIFYYSRIIRLKSIFDEF